MSWVWHQYFKRMEMFDSHWLCLYWGIELLCNVLDGYFKLHKVIGEKKTSYFSGPCQRNWSLHWEWGSSRNIARYHFVMYTITANSKTLCCYQTKWEFFYGGWSLRSGVSDIYSPRGEVPKLSFFQAPGESNGVRQPLPRQASLEELKTLLWIARKPRVPRLDRQHTSKYVRRCGMNLDHSVGVLKDTTDMSLAQLRTSYGLCLVFSRFPSSRVWYEYGSNLYDHRKSKV